MIKQKLAEKHLDVLKTYGIQALDLKDVYLLKYKSGEYIFRQGHEADYLMFITSGRMKVVYTAPNGNSLLLCFYESGVLGDIELMLGNNTALSGVQAITDASCIGVPTAVYAERLRGNAVFLNKIAEDIAKKLNQSSRNNAVNILNSLESRLCAYIALTENENYFKEKKTVLSEILGTSYRHLLRTLDRLCAKGVLKKESRGYRIIDKKALAEMGDDYYLI